ncbi:MAG TPA: DUF4331 domain-containing protein [Acidothermaceae bacterium]|jgi:hypothetical protein
MSSHREAPEISKDPVADSSDLYAFVSPDKPGYATIIANYVPLQLPDGGPNFFEFGDDVLYEIHISNRGDAQADITYGFRFHTVVFNKNTFLYNTGQITSIFDPHFNRRQYYSVTRTTRGGSTVQLGGNLEVPPCNIGPRSTPNYEHLAAQCVHGIGDRTFFAGQRADAFHVDLGSVFDLLDLRPFQNLHVISSPAASGVNSLADLNVHSIAMRVPLSDLTVSGKTPVDPTRLDSVVGIWTTASRQRTHVYEGPGATAQNLGGWEQVSRLGNPLINEVVIPMGSKDDWNHSAPSSDSNYAASFEHPEVAGLLPVLYPGVFKNLAAYTKPRLDLVAILGTGIPSGVVPGFQNYTGKVVADMLRLNLAIPATPFAKASPAGLAGGDPAGFPNGRRVTDDVVTIELRAIAGLLIPLVDKSFTPDAATSKIDDGSAMPPTQQVFPYLNTPHDGYSATA